MTWIGKKRSKSHLLPRRLLDEEPLSALTYPLVKALSILDARGVPCILRYIPTGSDGMEDRKPKRVSVLQLDGRSAHVPDYRGQCALDVGSSCCSGIRRSHLPSKNQKSARTADQTSASQLTHTLQLCDIFPFRVRDFYQVWDAADLHLNAITENADIDATAPSAA
jgi:hypothetical protein